MELIFASHNENKVKEIKKLFSERVKILSLNDIEFYEEIPETGETLEENALIKAKTIYEISGKNVFADDSGLFVNGLNGAPGVFSARYAGTGNSADNIQKLLQELGDHPDRTAYFKTVICLILDGKEHFISGEIHGEIISELRGTDGFGYDPIFVPNAYSETFAEMNLEQKNQISHRAQAIKKLINFIEN